MGLKGREREHLAVAGECVTYLWRGEWMCSEEGRPLGERAGMEAGSPGDGNPGQKYINQPITYLHATSLLINTVVSDRE